jgi:DNA-directed RNA polymerase subunit RPC12/RpoP
LSNSGFEPNERFEGIVGEGDGVKSLSQYFGFTPLHILAATAQELKSIDAVDVDIETMQRTNFILEVIQSAADILIRNGARTNLSPPPETRLDRETPPGCFSLSESLELIKYEDAPIIDRKGLKMNDDVVISLLGGKDRVRASQTCFAVMPKITNIVDGALNVQMDLSSVADSNEPGGSDSNSCAICWSEFGVISNRKQFCQVSTRYVCNECSTKRLVERGKDIRVSDGQYLVAKAQAAKSDVGNKSQVLAVGKPKEPNGESKNRLSLGLFNKSSSSANDSAKDEHSTKEKITSAVSSLNETRNAVLERGDKLNRLADKTEALSNASLDFANMAKELNKQQNSWW